jgi:threonine/homoserine/homoserine lactone efflux protein
MDMWHALVGGMVAGYGIAIPLGAIAVLIVANGASHGFTAAAAGGLGAATADLTYATIAVAAGGALRPHLASVSTWIHLASGFTLTTVAAHGIMAAARTRNGPTSVRAGNLHRTYIRFLGLTLVNPLTIAYFAAIVIADRAAAGLANEVMFAAGVALASASWQTLLAASGALLGKSLPHRASLVTAILGNSIVLALAARQFASL